VVEYALILASNSAHGFATDFRSLAEGLNWAGLQYLIVGLFALLVARWAFRSSNSQ
jgi:hypothetical protein